MATATTESVEKDRISKPDLYVASKMDPGRDAWDLLEQVWIERPGHIHLPVDPFAVARRVGIEVWADDELPPEIAGILRKEADFKGPEIFLNDLDARERRGFTCAHALGHYSRNVEMGRGGAWEIVEGRDFFMAELSNAEETYATEFAAELLMPRVVLREITDSRSVASLAAMFRVTGDVMRFRLDQVGWR
jgi:hypothetical protein